MIRLRDINRVKLIVALVTGSVFAGLTFYMLNYDPGFSGPGLIFMMPDLYITIMVSGHRIAPSMWVVVVANFVFCFGLVYAAVAIWKRQPTK